MEAEYSYGHLAVVCPPPVATGLAQLREAIVGCYLQDGVYPPSHPSMHDLWLDELYVEWESGPHWNDSGRLAEDELLIDWNQRPWGTVFLVKSHRCELTPPGQHPLALRLSTRWPVLSVQAGDALELCLYRHLAPVQYATSDRRRRHERPVDAELSFRWLAKLSGTDEQRLRERFSGYEPDRDDDPFLKQARLDPQVWHFSEMFEGCDIYGFDENQLMLFRNPDRVDWQPYSRCIEGCGRPCRAANDPFCEQCA